MRATLAALVERGVLLVAERNGRLVGMASAALSPHPFNRDVLIAQELFWYVLPAHRVGCGAALLDALEAAVRDEGAALFVMVCVEGQRERALTRAYRRRGFAPVERTFIKRV